MIQRAIVNENRLNLNVCKVRRVEGYYKTKFIRLFKAICPLTQQVFAIIPGGYLYRLPKQFKPPLFMNMHFATRVAIPVSDPAFFSSTYIVLAMNVDELFNFLRISLLENNLSVFIELDPPTRSRKTFCTHSIYEHSSWYAKFSFRNVPINWFARENDSTNSNLIHSHSLALYA
jgi:hypothetical protein